MSQRPQETGADKPGKTGTEFGLLEEIGVDIKDITLDAIYIEVSAEVRYWEDATVNGAEDADGTLIPMRNGKLWAPVIRLADGVVVDWPQGTDASIHYKVCDQGEYWLLDSERQRIAKWRSHYVPDDFLCPGENGYGDYIIFDVASDGKIVGWRPPSVDPAEWIKREATKATDLKVDPLTKQTLLKGITSSVQHGVQASPFQECRLKESWCCLAGYLGNFPEAKEAVEAILSMLEAGHERG